MPNILDLEQDKMPRELNPVEATLSPDGDEFYAYNSHLNVYRLGDATHTLRQNSRQRS